MTLKKTVVCDTCGNDLSDSGLMPQYLLELTSLRMRSTSNIEYAVMVTDPIPAAKHFCGLPCLNRWVTAQR